MARAQRVQAHLDQQLERLGPGLLADATSASLAILGLKSGEAVRWRTPGGSRWHLGRVSHRERDGSVAVTDGRGSARSFPVDRLEVPCAGPRGGRSWEPLTERAARTEQLRLL